MENFWAKTGVFFLLLTVFCLIAVVFGVFILHLSFDEAMLYVLIGAYLDDCARDIVKSK